MVHILLPKAEICDHSLFTLLFRYVATPWGHNKLPAYIGPKCLGIIGTHSLPFCFGTVVLWRVLTLTWYTYVPAFWGSFSQNLV